MSYYTKQTPAKQAFLDSLKMDDGKVVNWLTTYLPFITIALITLALFGVPVVGTMVSSYIVLSFSINLIGMIFLMITDTAVVNNPASFYSIAILKDDRNVLKDVALIGTIIILLFCYSSWIATVYIGSTIAALGYIYLLKKHFDIVLADIDEPEDVSEEKIRPFFRPFL